MADGRRFAQVYPVTWDIPTRGADAPIASLLTTGEGELGEIEIWLRGANSGLPGYCAEPKMSFLWFYHLSLAPALAGRNDPLYTAQKTTPAKKAQDNDSNAPFLG